MRRATYMTVGLLVFGLTLVSVVSCNKDKTQIEPIVEPGECPDTISFATTVEPLIQANCSTSGCHDAATASQGYNLEGYTNISANASAISNVINHNGGVTPMPFGQPKLNDTLIKQFDCWVSQGTLDN